MRKKTDYRFAALWRFALSLSVFNILGHTFFGFEQSWAQPLIALATAYTLELLLELIDARANSRPLRFGGGLYNFVSFMLPAHITGLAVAMLLYANDRLLPIAFAAAVAVGSKAIFRVSTPRGSQHFLNPSNFGITVTLLCFPWVGIAPPYHFTENLSGWGDWILPALIVVSGTFVNSKFTRKLPLILGWVGGFIAQAVIRSLLGEATLTAALVPMTGLAFILFTFYMISDPGTTPFTSREQVLFGVAVAAVYGILMTMHIVFGFFFGLTLVCTVRGLSGYLHPLLTVLRPLPTTKTDAPVPVAMRRLES
jgi:Na+-translocating ferredoxin:NAD+ oxidoreductase RnfD subunit